MVLSLPCLEILLISLQSPFYFMFLGIFLAIDDTLIFKPPCIRSVQIYNNVVLFIIKLQYISFLYLLVHHFLWFSVNSLYFSFPICYKYERLWFCKILLSDIFHSVIFLLTISKMVILTFQFSSFCHLS